MGGDESLAQYRDRHDELLAERDSYCGGNAPRGEIAGWVARRLEESVFGDGKRTVHGDSDRNIVAVWCDLVELYQEYDAESGTDEYRTRIISLLHSFEYPIPSRVIAGVVGCSKGHARRYYWDDEGQCVREKQWSLAQRKRQATPKQVEAVLERDGYCCVRCKRAEPLLVHHIVPVSQGGTTAEENLVTLCKSCHRAAHGKAMNRGKVQYESTEEFHTWLMPDE